MRWARRDITLDSRETFIVRYCRLTPRSVISRRLDVGLARCTDRGTVVLEAMIAREGVKRARPESTVRSP